MIGRDRKHREKAKHYAFIFANPNLSWLEGAEEEWEYQQQTVK